MIKLNIRTLAAGAGIGNPLVFSRQSGLAYAMCYKLWNDQQTRIDLSTIDRLCEVLRCSPGELFLRDPSPAGKSTATHLAEEAGQESRNPGPAKVPAGCRRIRWID
jgi:putative transcriptional regulator